ncbi:MAG: hypothetical protein ABL967_13435 [Bryobacteraceae bacterium]
MEDKIEVSQTQAKARLTLPSNEQWAFMQELTSTLVNEIVWPTLERRNASDDEYEHLSGEECERVGRGIKSWIDKRLRKQILDLIDENVQQRIKTDVFQELECEMERIIGNRPSR